MISVPRTVLHVHEQDYVDERYSRERYKWDSHLRNKPDTNIKICPSVDIKIPLIIPIAIAMIDIPIKCEDIFAKWQANLHRGSCVKDKTMAHYRDDLIIPII